MGGAIDPAGCARGSGPLYGMHCACRYAAAGWIGVLVFPVGVPFAAFKSAQMRGVLYERRDEGDGRAARREPSGGASASARQCCEGEDGNAYVYKPALKPHAPMEQAGLVAMYEKFKARAYW